MTKRPLDRMGMPGHEEIRDVARNATEDVRERQYKHCPLFLEAVKF